MLTERSEVAEGKRRSKQLPLPYDFSFGFDFPEQAIVLIFAGPSRAGKSHFLKAYIHI